MGAETSFLVEEFIDAITTQLDRVQDSLRVKAVNRPLTYALKGEKQHAELFAGALARLKERLTATRYSVCPGNSASQGCVVGNLVNPGITVASLNVPLVAPMTEYGDRINQLDLNISKIFRYGRASFQPKIDFFNLLNVSSVYAVRTSNSVMLYGTSSYMQPQSIIVGRVFQLGGVIRF